jgi:osmotically-inducible protein OsmY
LRSVAGIYALLSCLDAPGRHGNLDKITTCASRHISCEDRIVWYRIQGQCGKETIIMSVRKSSTGWCGIVILVVALGGCATYEKCGAGGCQGDAKITANVQAALVQRQELGPPNSINVQTLNHVVYLSGEVSEGFMRETAVSVAQQIKGVARVEDTIAITK